jgi:uncharacterized membrane protein YphA (DoxX/SURF4 family)
VATASFEVKFNVSAWETLALAAIEFAAAAGMIAGGVLVNRYGVWATRLATVGVVISQALAIIYAHHHWLEFVPNGNAEFNSTLILIAMALFIAPGVAWRTRRSVS